MIPNLRMPSRCVVLAFACAGCDRAAALPEGHPVQGVLQIAGKPFENIVVEFVADLNPDDRFAGCTDRAGRFLLVGRELSPQLPAGSYLVVLKQLESSPGFLMASPDLLAELPDAEKSVVPEAYTNPDTTPLVVEIPSHDNLYMISVP